MSYFCCPLVLLKDARFWQDYLYNLTDLAKYFGTKCVFSQIEQNQAASLHFQSVVFKVYNEYNKTDNASRSWISSGLTIDSA